MLLPHFIASHVAWYERVLYSPGLDLLLRLTRTGHGQGLKLGPNGGLRFAVYLFAGCSINATSRSVIHDWGEEVRIFLRWIVTRAITWMLMLTSTTTSGTRHRGSHEQKRFDAGGGPHPTRHKARSLCLFRTNSPLVLGIPMLHIMMPEVSVHRGAVVLKPKPCAHVASQRCLYPP